MEEPVEGKEEKDCGSHGGEEDQNEELCGSQGKKKRTTKRNGMSRPRGSKKVFLFFFFWHNVVRYVNSSDIRNLFLLCEYFLPLTIRCISN